MALPYGVETTGEEVCPLHRCHWPVGSFAWTSVGRPGGYKNIVCEELNAQCWSLEERLKRPSEHNCRILHGCDSASGTGALLKGRSPSRMVNRYCKKKQHCALVEDSLHSFRGSLPNRTQRMILVRGMVYDVKVHHGSPLQGVRLDLMCVSTGQWQYLQNRWFYICVQGLVGPAIFTSVFWLGAQRTTQTWRLFLLAPWLTRLGTYVTWLWWLA